MDKALGLAAGVAEERKVLRAEAIGIGGAVARSPLPHHPTCGTASGGSEGYAGLSSKEGRPSDAK
jgi:hypothetical protein